MPVPYNWLFFNLLRLNYKKNMMKKQILTLLLASILLTLTSCYTSGYGCKGNSRCITRVR